jgi:hypothetical protein
MPPAGDHYTQPDYQRWFPVAIYATRFELRVLSGTRRLCLNDRNGVETRRRTNAPPLPSKPYQDGLHKIFLTPPKKSIHPPLHLPDNAAADQQGGRGMDWTLAIDRNRAALKRILSELLGMAGLRGQFTFFPVSDRFAEGEEQGPADLAQVANARSDSGGLSALPQDVALAEKGNLSPALGSPPTLPRRLHRAVLRLLRPAESAARRLVVVAARDIVVTLPPPRPRKPRRKSAFLKHGTVGTGIVLPKGVRAPDAPAHMVAALRRPAAPGGPAAPETVDRQRAAHFGAGRHPAGADPPPPHAARPGRRNPARAPAQGAGLGARRPAGPRDALRPAARPRRG